MSTLAPYTEADPAALLLCYLRMLGSACPRPVFRLGMLTPPPRLFTLIMGPSGDGRKSTAFDQIKHLFELAGRAWHGNIVGSLAVATKRRLITAAGQGPTLLFDDFGYLLGKLGRGNLGLTFKLAYKGHALRYQGADPKKALKVQEPRVSFLGRSAARHPTRTARLSAGRKPAGGLAASAMSPHAAAAPADRRVPAAIARPGLADRASTAHPHGARPTTVSTQPRRERRRGWRSV